MIYVLYVYILHYELKGIHTKIKSGNLRIEKHIVFQNKNELVSNEQLSSRFSFFLFMWHSIIKNDQTL